MSEYPRADMLRAAVDVLRHAELPLDDHDARIEKGVAQADADFRAAQRALRAGYDAAVDELNGAFKLKRLDSLNECKGRHAVLDAARKMATKTQFAAGLVLVALKTAKDAATKSTGRISLPSSRSTREGPRPLRVVAHIIPPNPSAPLVRLDHPTNAPPAPCPPSPLRPGHAQRGPVAPTAVQGGCAAAH